MNLQKLQTQREGHRRFVDRYLIKIEQAKENSSLLEFNAILESVEAKVQILETLNEKILSNTAIECIEDEIFQAEEYSLQLEIKLRQLREFRNQQEKFSTTSLPREDQQTSREIHDQENSRESGDQQSLRERDGQRNGNASNSEDRYFNDRNVSNNSYNQFYRLPKISLPTFNGDILTWQSFWDSYESTIHMNNNLTDVQKFSYLKSQLEGKAAQVIEGFAMTNVNYIRAVDLLKERFGQQHKIMHVAMQSLLKLPAPSNRVTSLRNFYDKMETFIRSLEAMGQCQESYGSLLVPVVLEKLPSEIRKQLARENVENNWRLEDLRASINREICIMEAGTARSEPEVDDCEATAAFSMTAKSKRKPQHLAQSSFGRSNRRDDIKCAFCEQGHKSVECKTHCDTNSRLDIVKQNRLCFNCLRKHPVAKCNSIKRCQICNRKHHTAICSRRQTAQQPNSSPTEITQTPEAGVFHSSAGLHGKGVLLKTAIATVSSTKVQLYTNILFDEGSHKSFITESLAEELELTRNGTETIYLSSFGSASNKIMQVDTATVYLVTDECQKIPVKVLIVPTISTPINNRLQNTASKLPYLRGLKLAHPVTEDNNFTISMLIGADFYWDIVEDRIIRGEGPTAVKSKIGYLLSGPVPAESAHSTNHVCNVNTLHFSPDMLERFWSLESMGITQTTEDNDKSDYFKNYQQSCIEFKDSRYSAKLPWKLEHPPLPTNYEVTKKRTENTIRRLQRDPYLLQKYDDIITEQERRGFIEKVITDTPPTGQVHYIPHHPVKKESSTTPIRIVYDCSCRQSPYLPSLNDCLESTPPILNDLSNILVRFRLHKYAVTADIEKAFLHVGLDERDRDATRFFGLVTF
ncbi:uncharacterized protein LOC123533438 [Mercenaria mercenaria]|uniref:uncharacterized protein LOC123533438 n=1 Tax=Mercenaria mercenaria TaxID=6596 RepID=UPI00234F8550|nr:uncharacterized protein LOC123533438 [Mercenaria mercenaria]